MISNTPTAAHKDHVHASAKCCDHTSARQIPCREILTVEDLARFQSSTTFENLFAFVTRLNEAIRNKTLNRSGEEEGAQIKELKAMLDTIAKWIDEIPAAEIGLSRFGNPSFRIFHEKLTTNVDSLLATLVKNDEDRREVSHYLLNSFGDKTRIDYGTGHEANFICFLMCLYELDLVPKDENGLYSIVAVVFWKYIQVMRKLQFTYWLEPAGSHGVWGLDDYQFLPFLFGSAQLMDHKHLRPKSIHDKEIIAEFADEYMYLSCIKHINTIKKESLRWHSPMLDDISGVKKWSKVNEGMFKMYRQEVLNKLPIMQHFLFGSLIPFTGTASKENLGEEMEHVHAMGQERPLCCTIRVPSTIASVRSGETKPRALPFD